MPGANSFDNLLVDSRNYILLCNKPTYTKALRQIKSSKTFMTTEALYPLLQQKLHH